MFVAWSWPAIRSVAKALPDSLAVLGQNRIGDVGAAALAHKLPVNLSELNLECNEIGDVGARALASKLCPRPLVRLCLRNNTVGSEDVLENLAAAARRCGCRQIWLDGNPAHGDKALVCGAPAPDGELVEVLGIEELPF